jgi:hypothetical protein
MCNLSYRYFILSASIPPSQHISIFPPSSPLCSLYVQVTYTSTRFSPTLFITFYHNLHNIVCCYNSLNFIHTWIRISGELLALVASLLGFIQPSQTSAGTLFTADHWPSLAVLQDIRINAFDNKLHDTRPSMCEWELLKWLGISGR